MAEKVMGGFDSLIDLARKFVETQKGVWEHADWLNFLSDARKKGFELTSDMETYLGSALEAMKKVYEATSATKGMENVMSDISDLTVNFVKKTKGVWDQSGWEAFLTDFQKKGIDLTDEMISYFGEVLEAARSVYNIFPPGVSKPEKKATPKKVKGTKTTK